MPEPARPAERAHIAGEVGIWVFVLGDMLVFGICFCVFLVARIDAPEVFAASRPELNQTLGALNMVILLTSSLLVAWGVRATARGDRAFGSRLFGIGAACGLAFLAVKGFEYGQKLDHGIDPGTNDFFMYFFIFTGVHAVHVLLGVGILLFLRAGTRRATPNRHELRTVESGATFWHMVDLLWVVLFPLLYLAS